MVFNATTFYFHTISLFNFNSNNNIYFEFINFRITLHLISTYAMLVGNESESKGVSKYKNLTTIATNGKHVWTEKVNIACEKLLTLFLICFTKKFQKI